MLTPLASSLPSGHHFMNERNQEHIRQRHNLASCKEVSYDKSGSDSLALVSRQTIEITRFAQKGDCHDEPKRNSVAVVFNNVNKLDQQFLTSRTRHGETDMQTEIEILETRENPAIVWW